MNSKAQAWFTDFIIGMSIFILFLIIYFSHTSNLSKREIKAFDDLTSDAKSISSLLVLEGYPANWTISNVQRIGLTNNDQKINQNKLDLFFNLSYGGRKSLFNTQYDYFVFFKNNDGCLINASGNFGIGHPGVAIVKLAQETACNGFVEGSVDLSGVNFENIVRTDRLLIYKSKIIDMVIYLWQ